MLNMGYIYQNAALTIAAANEPGSWGRGLLRGRHPLMARPCLVRFQIGQQSREAVFCQHVASVPSILDKRLWIFQEQVLSRRTLEFGPNYAVWRCNAMDMAEPIPFNIRDVGQEVPPCSVTDMATVNCDAVDTICSGPPKPGIVSDLSIFGFS